MNPDLLNNDAVIACLELGDRCGAPPVQVTGNRGDYKALRAALDARTAR